MKTKPWLLALLISAALQFCLLAPATPAATLQAGPGKPFATPCAAIAAASPGDRIEIDTTGNYSGDVCQWSTSNLTIVGVGTGRAVINAAGNNSGGKAIWVISGNNTTVENIEFTGATVPDMNGAGIRQEGNNLTVRNCYFHDNQDGILTGGGNSTILIEFSEFYRNGASDGFSHNLYIGNVAKFIFRYNYSHGAVIGHLLKSRAAENEILYNRLSDEAMGTASYDIDLPNGGLSFVVGNLIEKGPQAQNSALVSYQEEGAAAGNPDHELFVINNTMVNDLGHGTFVVVDPSVTVTAVIKNNIFQGAGSVTTQGNATKANNFPGNASLVNPANFDYHILAGSPAIDAGADPGQGAGVALTPVFQYVHPSCAEGRTTTGSAIDIGAYEFNGGDATPPPNAPSRCGAPPPPAPSANLSASSLTFAGQILDTSSPGKSVTLTNVGNATLTITSIAIAGTNAGDFSQANTCGASLAAGANCSITVTFTPTAAGTRTSTLSVTNNAAGSPHTVSLSGSGVATAPAATLFPASLTFASQAPGTTSAAQAVKLTNTGNAALNISGISVTGDFAQTNNCGATLAPAGLCTINVAFAPTAGGTRTGSLNISDDAPASPQSIGITGTGNAPTPTVTVAPVSLTFSSLLVGAASPVQSTKLTNTGTAALSISGITTSGDFLQANNCGTSLAPAANCTINVSFKPSSGGTRTGSISIANTANPSPQTVNLTGTGMDFSLPASSGSATINAGQPASFMFAVSLEGGFNQLISFSCTGTPAASTCTVTPSSITPNGTTAATVSVSITTKSRGFIIPEIRTLPPSTVLRLLLTICTLAALLALVAGRHRRLALGLASVLLLVALTSGCVGLAGKLSSTPPPGPGTGTPAGTFTISVTGSSGNISHSTTYTLKVN